jgi:uncharacterized Zn-binding protein involved in type VI secretion
MKMIAVKGNRTTTGGYVLDGDETCLDDGQPMARHMGLASWKSWTDVRHGKHIWHG